MPIDWQAIEDAGGFGKGKPAKLEKADRAKTIADADKKGSDEAKERSKGQCEVVWFGRKARRVRRCDKRANQIHHMVGGRGKRGRGISALAKHKQHVCGECHPLITGHVLRRIGSEVPLWTDEYERVDK
jgi:hypothetical protein